MTIKFEDNGQEYEGPVWVGPTDRSHCERCDGGNKPIPTGIGVHFKDAQTGHYVVVGRSCAEKLTGEGIKLSSFPVIGMGFDEAKFRTNTSPRLRVEMLLILQILQVYFHLELEATSSHEELLLITCFQCILPDQLKENFLKILIFSEQECLVAERSSKSFFNYG